MPFTWAVDLERNDLVLQRGKLSTIYGSQQVRQRVIIALQHYWEEYFLNVLAGVPWYELILGSKDLKQAEMLIRNTILSVPDVLGVVSISYLSIGSHLDRAIAFSARIEVVGQAGPSIEDIVFSLNLGE